MPEEIILTTPRLLLRPFDAADFPAWTEAMTDPEMMRFLGGPQSTYGSWVSFRAIAGGWSIDGFSRFSIIERHSRRWVGWTGPARPDGWPGPEVGWGIVRQCWGRGYALEAAIPAIEWCFQQLDWREVTHCISPDNLPSQQLARKLGSVKRGMAELPGFSPDHSDATELWGQTREHWYASRSH